MAKKILYSVLNIAFFYSKGLKKNPKNAIKEIILPRHTSDLKQLLSLGCLGFSRLDKRLNEV